MYAEGLHKHRDLHFIFTRERSQKVTERESLFITLITRYRNRRREVGGAEALPTGEGSGKGGDSRESDESLFFLKKF